MESRKIQWNDASLCILDRYYFVYTLIALKQGVNNYPTYKAL